MTRPIKLAFSTQKGGAGKTSLTVLSASYLHYLKGYHTAIVDCDYPQNSISEMRERDLEQVMQDEALKQKAHRLFTKLGKKGYPVIESTPEEALEDGSDLAKELQLDFIFYDMPGTLNNHHTLKILSDIDYLFVPISADRIELESSLQHVIAINDALITTGQSNIKAIHLLWNKVDGREKTDLYEVYEDVIEKLGFPIMQTRIPDSKRFRREQNITQRGIFRSTLFPPDRNLLRGSRLEELINELLEITKS